jgi:hypothetical protein
MHLALVPIDVLVAIGLALRQLRLALLAATALRTALTARRRRVVTVSFPARCLRMVEKCPW